MEKKLGEVRLYENKDLTDLEAKQYAVYNQIIDIEKSIGMNREEINLDRFLDGLNIELSKEGLTSKGNDRTLERMRKGLLINKEFLIKYCLSNTRKGLPEWFDMELMKTNKKAQAITQTPADRINDIEIQKLLDKKELQQELARLKELKEEWSRDRSKEKKKRIKEFQAQLQAKYM